MKPPQGPVHEEMLYLQILGLMGIKPDKMNWEEVLADFGEFLKEKN